MPGAAVLVLVLTVDLRTAIGFSSAAVLVYYAVTNAAALTLPPAQRRWPRPVAMLGLVGCLVLASNLPAASLGTGVGILVAGVLGRLVLRRIRQPNRQ